MELLSVLYFDVGGDDFLVICLCILMEFLSLLYFEVSGGGDIGNFSSCSRVT